MYFLKLKRKVFIFYSEKEEGDFSPEIGFYFYFFRKWEKHEDYYVERKRENEGWWKIKAVPPLKKTLCIPSVHMLSKTTKQT